VVADGHHVERLGGQQLRQRIVAARPGGVAILEGVGLGIRVRRFGGDGHQFHVRQLRQDAEDLLGCPSKPASARRILRGRRTSGGAPACAIKVPASVPASKLRRLVGVIAFLPFRRARAQS